MLATMMLLLFLSLPLASSSSFSSKELSKTPELLKHLALMRPLSEVSVILSESLANQPTFLGNDALPISVFSLPRLHAEVEEMSNTEPCPIFIKSDEDMLSNNGNRSIFFVGEKQLYGREDVLPRSVRAMTMLFLVTTIHDVDLAIQLIRKRVLICKQKVDRGLLELHNRLIFMTPANAGLEESVFAHRELQYHRRVAVVKEIKDEREKYSVSTYDLINERIGVSSILSLCSQGEPLTDEAMWPTVKDFQGRIMNIGTIPYAALVMAETMDASLVKQPNQTMTGFWGSEVYLLETVCESRNFDVEYFVHPEWVTGNILPSGHWSGVVAWTMQERVDFSITMLYGNLRSQVVAASLVILPDPHMTFAAPWPSLYPKSFAIVRPFGLAAWVAIIAAILVASFFFFAVAKKEGSIMGLFFFEWAILHNSVWYCYGTMVGESITRGTKSRDAPALRILVGIWLLSCFIISAGYAGNLKKFLVSREELPPINTLQDIIESNLPWKLILYGETEETLMAESDDPIMQKIWKDKIVATEYEESQRHSNFSHDSESCNLNSSFLSLVIEQLEDVYEGNSIFIDYSDGLEVHLRLYYSSPDGQPSIHISTVPIMRPSYMVWNYDKFNPLVESFDPLLRRLLEANLFEHWEEKVFAHMRLQSRLQGEYGNKAPYDHAAISPLNLDDLQGVFLLFAILTLLEIMCFALASCNARANKISTEKSK